MGREKSGMGAPDSGYHSRSPEQSTAPLRAVPPPLTGPTKTVGARHPTLPVRFLHTSGAAPQTARAAAAAAAAV